MASNSTHDVDATSETNPLKRRKCEESLPQLTIGDKFMVIARPSGMGKLLVADMLKLFCPMELTSDGDESTMKKTDKLFIGTSIYYSEVYTEHFGKHPVVHLNFAKAYGDMIEATIVEELQASYNDYAHLHIPPFNHNYIKGIQNLIRVLHLKYAKKIIIIIDEFDSPLNTYTSEIKDLDPGTLQKKAHAYYKFLCSMLQPEVEMTVLFGSLVVDYNYLFRDTKRLFTMSSTLLQPFQFITDFGFTVPEVQSICANIQNFDLDALRKMYAGFFCAGVELFNCNSIVSF